MQSRYLGRKPGTRGIALAALGILVVGVMGIVSSSSDRSTVRELQDGTGVTEHGIKGAEVRAGLPSGTRYFPKYRYTTFDGVQRTIVDQDACVSVESRLSRKPIRSLVDTDDRGSAFIDEHKSEVGRTSHTIFSTAMLALGMLKAAPVHVVRRRRSAR